MIKYGAINAWKWLHHFRSSSNLFNYEELIGSKISCFGPCFSSWIDYRICKKKSIWTRGLGLKLVFSLVLLKSSPCWLTSAKLHHWGHTTTCTVCSNKSHIVHDSWWPPAPTTLPNQGRRKLGGLVRHTSLLLSCPPSPPSQSFAIWKRRERIRYNLLLLCPPTFLDLPPFLCVYSKQKLSQPLFWF